MKIFGYIPTTILGVIVYAITHGLFYLGYVSDPGIDIFAVPLPSQAAWLVSVDDINFAFSLFLLFIEIIKSTRTSNAGIMEHGVSTFFAVGYLLLFLLVPIFATSLFFFMVMMEFIEALAGYVITATAARRDMTLG